MSKSSINSSLKLSPVSEKNNFPFSKREVMEIKSDINTTNGMSKIGIPLSLLGLGIVNSSIGRHNIGQATDILKNLDDNQIKKDNSNMSDIYIAEKVKKIKNLQSATLGSDIATLFIIPAPVTIPLSIILNAVNWHTTGKLKKQLNDTL